MKYAGHHVIRLAQIGGEQKGIENVRKRRLEKEPEGFFLETTDDFYQCGICGENRTTNEMWWNLEGTRCKDCWRNIKTDVIPSLKHLYNNNDTYFQDWQIESDFGVKPATRGKLKREGLLKGRDLKREDGTIYCTVYLAEENQEFLKQYKRKEKPPWLLTDLLGNEINIRA